MKLLARLLLILFLDHWATYAAGQLDVDGNAGQLDVEGSAGELGVDGSTGQLDVEGSAEQLDVEGSTLQLEEEHGMVNGTGQRDGADLSDRVGSSGPCNRVCSDDRQCYGSCPYCKQLSESENFKVCRPDTMRPCGMGCLSSSQCRGGSCPVCFAAMCQQCQSDSHCRAAFGSAKPYCKRITATRRECRADTCSMACLSSSECKGSCPVCFAAKCQQCQSDSHCRSTFGSAKPYCKRITATHRECRADTCSMACLSSSECKGSCPVCFAAKCQQCQSDSHCRATFGSAKPYCKRLSATRRECRADTCSMFCLSRSECKGRCGRCCGFKCKASCSCFPGDSLVTMDGGVKKKMENLRIGDMIMTVENGKLVPTKVLGFLDKRINQTADYLKIILEDDKSLSISPRHAMFIMGEENVTLSILAKDVSLGNMVIIETGKEIKPGRVKDITVESKKGAYVPLTDTGTLLVDGVLVSSYTNTDHWLAHIALAPLRWWPTLFLDNEKTQDMEGIRTFPQIVRQLGNLLGLVTMAEAKKDITNDPSMTMAIMTIEEMDKTEF